MTDLTRTANDVYSPLDAQGNARTLNPDEIVLYHTEVEGIAKSALSTITGSNLVKALNEELGTPAWQDPPTAGLNGQDGEDGAPAVTADTRLTAEDLFADDQIPVNGFAFVFDDTEANNGLYRRNAAAVDEASWQKIEDSIPGIRAASRVSSKQRFDPSVEGVLGVVYGRRLTSTGQTTPDASKNLTNFIFLKEGDEWEVTGTERGRSALYSGGFIAGSYVLGDRGIAPQDCGIRFEYPVEDHDTIQFIVNGVTVGARQEPGTFTQLNQGVVPMEALRRSGGAFQGDRMSGDIRVELRSLDGFDAPAKTNLFIREDAEDGIRILNNPPDRSKDENFTVTGFVKVTPNSVITAYNAHSILQYDINKQPVGSTFNDWLLRGNAGATTHQLDATCEYIRFSILLALADKFTCVYGSEALLPSAQSRAVIDPEKVRGVVALPWQNQKAGLLGDSITAGIGAFNGWAEHIERFCGFTNVQNLAIGSASIGARAGSSDAQIMARAFANLDDDCDCVIITGGLVDSLEENGVPLGTIDDTTDATFYGAMNVLLDGLKLKYQTRLTRILFIFSPPTLRPADMEGYSEAARLSCAKHQVPFRNSHILDTWNHRVRPYIIDGNGVHSSALTPWSQDGAHLNQTGEFEWCKDVSSFINGAW